MNLLSDIINKAACLLLPLLILVLNPASMLAQSQAKTGEKDQTVRLKSELVQVRAVVTDKRGQIVGGLTKEDFELSENGQHQNISFFSAETVAPRVGLSDAKEPPANTSLRNREHEEPQRSIVLFVDTVHISFANVKNVKQAIHRFADEQMTDRDVAALITSSGALGFLEQFTGNRATIRAAADKLAPWLPTNQQSSFTPFLAAEIQRGNPEAISLAIDIVKMEEMIDRPNEAYIRGKANQVLAEAVYRRKVTLSSLKAVVEAIAQMPGQRMIVLFSEGFTLAGSGGSFDASELHPIISRASRAGVVIYSIGARGLTVPLVAPSLRGTIESPVRIGGRRPALTSYLSYSERDEENGLNSLAKDTGGEAFFNTNDFAGGLQKSLEDNRVYYALAYYAPDVESGDKDRKFRTIALHVKNHPDYKVRTQRGYRPSDTGEEVKPESPRQKLAQAMAAPLPATFIPVSATADYMELESDGSQVFLQVFVDAGALKYREQDGHYLNDLEIAAVVYDRTGKRVYVNTNQVQVNFSPERLETAKANGYRYNERLKLEPGLYQVRAGVLEPSTGQVGTGVAWVEVPDLSRGRLVLSDIILLREQKTGQETQAGSATESMSPSVTQGIRVYKRGEVLISLVKVYNCSAGEGATMRTEILLGDQPVYQSQWRAVASRSVAKDRLGLEVSEQLKLNNVEPGIYELRVTVNDPKSKKPAARSVLFGVER